MALKELTYFAFHWIIEDWSPSAKKQLIQIFTFGILKSRHRDLESDSREKGL